MDTLLTGFPISSTVHSLLALVKFTQDIADVPFKTRVFLHSLSRISIDLAELTRLRSLERAHSSSPEDLSDKYIDGVIADAREALHDVEAEIENCRGDLLGKGGRVSVWHRFEWYLWNEDRFLAKEKRLRTCHQSVLVCLGKMGAEERGNGKSKGKEVAGEKCCEYPQREDDVLISPRMWRKKSMRGAGDVRLDVVPKLPPFDFVRDCVGGDDELPPPPYKAANVEATPWLTEEDERIENVRCEMLLRVAEQRRGFSLV